MVSFWWITTAGASPTLHRIWYSNNDTALDRLRGAERELCQMSLVSPWATPDSRSVMTHEQTVRDANREGSRGPGVWRPHRLPRFFFHGLIGSHHQASYIAEPARENGLQIIAPNRPGVGRSDFVERKSP